MSRKKQLYSLFKSTFRFYHKCSKKSFIIYCVKNFLLSLDNHSFHPKARMYFCWLTNEKKMPDSRDKKMSQEASMDGLCSSSYRTVSSILQLENVKNGSTASADADVMKRQYSYRVGGYEMFFPKKSLRETKVDEVSFHCFAVAQHFIVSFENFSLLLINGDSLMNHDIEIMNLRQFSFHLWTFDDVKNLFEFPSTESKLKAMMIFASKKRKATNPQ